MSVLANIRDYYQFTAVNQHLHSVGENSTDYVYYAVSFRSTALTASKAIAPFALLGVKALSFEEAVSKESYAF